MVKVQVCLDLGPIYELLYAHSQVFIWLSVINTTENSSAQDMDTVLSVPNAIEYYAENKTMQSLPLFLFVFVSEQLYVCTFDVIEAKRLLTKETVCSLSSKNVLCLLLSPCAMMKQDEKQFTARHTKPQIMYYTAAHICSHSKQWFV